MSRKKGYQSRLKLFDRGNTRCPICLMPFKRDAVEEGLYVTLEHAPPIDLCIFKGIVYIHFNAT